MNYLHVALRLVLTFIALVHKIIIIIIIIIFIAIYITGTKTIWTGGYQVSLVMFAVLNVLPRGD